MRTWWLIGMECVVVAVAHDVRAWLGRIQSGVNVVTRTGLICIFRAAHICECTVTLPRLRCDRDLTA